MDRNENNYYKDKNPYQHHRSDGHHRGKTAPSHEMICSFDKLSIKSSSISGNSGSGYGSEAETELSMAEDAMNHNQFDENDNDNTPSQHSIANMKSSLGKGTFSDLLGPSDSELFQVKKELVTNLHIIDDAEEMVTEALKNLQSLWLNMDSKASLPSLATASQGQHKLIQKLTLVSFVIKEMGAEWSSFAGNPSEANKLKSMEHSNRLLQEQLESSRVIQSCLESELKYLEKEKSLLNDEIRELTLQIAGQPKPSYLQLSKRREEEENAQSHSQTMSNSVKFQNDDNFSQVYGQSSKRDQIPNRNRMEEDFKGLPPKPPTSRPSSGIRYMGKISTTNIRKREHDFDSIMNFVRERGNAMDSLNNQMEKYNEDFQTLQEEIYQVASEKMELHKAYEALLEEHNNLLKERQSYEGILNLILKEKRCTEESIHQILETLINKLNAIAAEEGTNCRFAVLESALHAVQGQNSSYRDEITELKSKLNTVEQNNLTVRAELEGEVSRAKTQAEESRQLLQVKTEEFTANQSSLQEKHDKLQELYDIVVSAKADVDKALIEKETELAKQQVAMEGLQKTNFKLQKKIQELQKTNTRILKESQEQKMNIDQLNTLVSQLRNSLKEQKTQWSERLKSAGDESSQIKDHCRWLQSQIDNLNHQLAESHERIKKYEKEKTTLAQQVMSAEEERKVVDRKLEELRAALQGDTVLREALMERNEALQIEINRLRRAKLMNLVITKEGDHSEPPSEMSTLDAMSSLASVPPTYAAEKGQRKNRYAAGIASNYPGKDTARNAISAHSSGMATSQGGSPSGFD